VLVNDQPLRIQAVISEKPPIARYFHILPPAGPIELLDAATGAPSDMFIVRAEHYTGFVEIDEFRNTVAEIELEIPTPTGATTDDPSLPPTDGVYLTAADVHAKFSGDDLAIILKNIRHRPFADPPPQITFVGEDEIESFDSSLTATAVVTSIELGLVAVEFPVELTGPVTTLASGKRGNTTGTFQTEMVSMSLTGDLGGLPIEIRESPQMSSLGATTITDLGGGLYQIDSFFDVFTEISIDGSGTWIPSTEATRVELVQPGVAVISPELPPFAAGQAGSFFDVFFEIDLGGVKYYARDPSHMSTVITHKPPAPGDVYQSTDRIQLYDAADQATGMFITAARHEPNPLTTTEIVGRQIFYNNSAFDGNTPGPDPMDDQAIAPDPSTATDPSLGKEALLPGETADFQNYTSYSKGINGLMIDVDGLPPGYVPTTGELQFMVGNDSDPSGPGWSPVPLPWSVEVYAGEGDGGSDRISLIWGDGEIRNEWLQVTAQLAGMDQPDVFYWGNAPAEAGDSMGGLPTTSTTDARVTTADLLLARNNPRAFLNPAGIDFPYDFDHDQRVNTIDVLLARNNQTSFFNDLKLISPSSAPAGDMAAAPAEETSQQGQAGELAWVYEAERLRASNRSSSNDDAKRAVDLLLTLWQ